MKAEEIMTLNGRNPVSRQVTGKEIFKTFFDSVFCALAGHLQA